MECKAYNYRLIGGNGGTLGFAVEKNGEFVFEPDTCQCFTATALREIAGELEKLKDAPARAAEPAPEPITSG
jgi:hypothetical protein